MRTASSLQIALILAVCLCTTQLCAQAQAASDAPNTTQHLNAIVLSSTDGKPVARVLVTSPDRGMAALTDAEGRFSFDLRRSVSAQGESQVASSFPPGLTSAINTIEFQVRKPGYINDSAILRVPAIQPSGSEPTLQLKIVPAGILAGNLYPDEGDLPANVYVQLHRKVIMNGTSMWTQAATSKVGNRGEFRFANLAPGDYKLLAPASVPYAPGSPSDSIKGFRAAFYPTADTLDAATPIHIGPGESATANLNFHSATFYRVTIPVAGLPDSKGFSINLITEMQGLNFTQENHVAQTYLPSGNYDLMLWSAPNNATQNPSVASVHLQVDAKPIRTAPIAFHPSFEIPVTVRREFTHLQSEPQQRSYPPVQINLQPVTPGRWQPQTAYTQDTGAITIKNLSEGLFRFSVYPSAGGYVASVTSGTTDLLREPYQVLANSAPRPVEVVLRDDLGTLTARLAQQQAADTEPVFLFCLELDRPETMPVLSQFQQNQANDSLPPGRYLLLALHRQLIQTLEYHNEDVLRDLISKGATITLSPNQKADIEVPLMPDGAN